eukprot:758834-Hanusia_phi.AAC.1
MSASHRGCSLICFLAVVWLDICTSFISTDRLRADDRHALHHLLHRERVLGFAHPISFRVRSGRGPSQVGVLMQTKGGKVQTETRSAESSDESSGQAAAPKKRRGRGIGKNEQVVRAAAVRSYKMSEMNFSSTSPLVDERSKNPPVGQPKSRKVRDKANDISARNASSPSSSSSSPQGRWKLRLIPDISEDMSTASSRMLREGLNAQRVIQKQSFQALMRKFTMLQQPRLEERGSSLLVNPGFYEKRRLENERSASMEGGMGVVPLSELKRRGLILPHINPQELHQGSNKIIKEWNTGSAVLDVAGDKLYSAGADQVISEWDLQDFSPSRKFEGHKDWITAMAIESSRGFLFSASDDRTVRVWDLRTGECVKVLRGHEEPLALEVVEDTLVVGCKGAVMVWDMRTWQLQHRLTNHTQVLRAMSAGLQVRVVSPPPFLFTSCSALQAEAAGSSDSGGKGGEQAVRPVGRRGARMEEAPADVGGRRMHLGVELEALGGRAEAACACAGGSVGAAAAGDLELQCREEARGGEVVSESGCCPA